MKRNSTLKYCTSNNKEALCFVTLIVRIYVEIPLIAKQVLNILTSFVAAQNSISLVGDG